MIIIFIISFITFLISIIINVAIEMKVMNKLKKEDLTTWNNLHWFAGRAKLGKFKKYLSKTNDQLIQRYNKYYNLTILTAIIAWLLIPIFFIRACIFN